ncbi:hypothetical protein BT63DRAFT_208026 [Microthyrium microscopicum]|uniref:Dopa 4,5-dioxygenase n=1 Tax=Microthyrium microscopicum TaxID=703497 RepID=A0A6A6UFV4_9PEZI|nr:hypothetical protein BT63DRAFT_208026 [Microthyrium microscopicum]
MSAPFDYEYPSPIDGYENLPALPEEKAEDGKSYVNPPSESLSPSYNSFTAPLSNDRRGGFDVHVYFQQNDEWQIKYAQELWERIRREFPELRIYRVWDKPVGPHPTAMFEVNIFTPAQFGAFIPWLMIHRGPLSALLHPNTGDDYRDHTQRAAWLGTPVSLNLRGWKSSLKKEPAAGLVEG